MNQREKFPSSFCWHCCCCCRSLIDYHQKKNRSLVQKPSPYSRKLQTTQNEIVSNRMLVECHSSMDGIANIQRILMMLTKSFQLTQLLYIWWWCPFSWFIRRRAGKRMRVCCAVCVCVCETIEHWVTQQQTEGHPNSRMQTQHNPPIFFSTSLLCDKHKQTVHWGSVAVVYHPYGNCVVHGTMVLESTLHKFCIQRQNKKWKHYKIIISHWFSLAMKHEGVPMQFAFNVMSMPLPFLHAPRRPSRPRYGSSIFFFLLHHRMLDGFLVARVTWKHVIFCSLLAACFDYVHRLDSIFNRRC